MLDSDLARLYGVSTKQLNQQVRRNLRRFPDDFMLMLTMAETASLRSQIVTLEGGRGRHSKFQALTFTEQGVAMLSSVLKSQKAVDVNIAIMRAFVSYRETLALNRDLALQFKELERRVDRHDGEIGEILETIRTMIEGPDPAAPKIGFRSERRDTPKRPLP